MLNEVFELLDKQKKESAITYWACRPCTVFAQGMNHRLKQIDDDIKELKQNTATNTTSIQNIEKKVEEIADQVKKSEGITKSDLEARLREEKDEARERKDKAANIIIHGVEDCNDEDATSEYRRSWDINS
jgi:DNA-binding transcriptional MerR regulator